MTIASIAVFNEHGVVTELTETKAFVHSFVKEVEIKPGKALMRYTVPMPEDSF